MNGSTAQMTPLEERLTQALAARAGQIDESDLAPGEVPDAQRRNRGLIVLAAAACTALVIGVPYGIAQLDGSEKPRGPLGTPTPGIGVGADWPVRSVGRIDLDGDGTDDVVQLRINPEPVLNPDGNVAARVEVALPSGTVFVLLNGAREYHLEGAVALPGSPGQEQLVSAGPRLRVLDLVDGQLRVLDAPNDPPLVRRTDNRDRRVTWSVIGDELVSVRSVSAFDQPINPVDRWRWKVQGAALVAVPLSGGCVTADDPTTVVSCIPEVPGQFREDQLSRTGMGDVLALDFLVAGSRATAELNQTSAGDTTLTVRAGKTWSVDASLGQAGPMMIGRGIFVGQNGERAILVGRLYPYPEGDPNQDFAVFGWVGGDLRALTPKGGGLVPATTTSVEGATLQRTWVQDGWLYTAVAVGEGDAQRVYRWTQDGETLEPIYLGMFCVNLRNPENPC